MTPEHTARLEDARFMADTGECLDGAARRLGLKTNTLEMFLSRHDRACLAALVARRPRDHNRYVDTTRTSIYELSGLGERIRTRERRRHEVAA